MFLIVRDAATFHKAAYGHCDNMLWSQRWPGDEQNEEKQNSTKTKFFKSFHLVRSTVANDKRMQLCVCSVHTWNETVKWEKCACVRTYTRFVGDKGNFMRLLNIVSTFSLSMSRRRHARMSCLNVHNVCSRHVHGAHCTLHTATARSTYCVSIYTCPMTAFGRVWRIGHNFIGAQTTWSPIYFSSRISMATFTTPASICAKVETESSNQTSWASVRTKIAAMRSYRAI